MSKDHKAPAVTVGSTVWWFDPNRRVYVKDEKGYRTGSPIYREHWRRTTIVSETRMSWVTKDGNKISKSDRRMRDSMGLKAVVFSLAEVDADCWINDNRYKVAERVRDCKDVDVLKRIAEIVGYVEKDAG